jgi:hypothetical protein
MGLLSISPKADGSYSLIFLLVTSQMHLRTVNGFCFRFTPGEEPEGEAPHPGRPATVVGGRD